MRATVKFLALSAAAIGWMAVAGQRADAVQITLTNASGAPGDVKSITATLQTQESQVAGTQNDIVFPQDLPVAIGADEFGDPLCTVNPAIRKTGTSFAFLPSECTVGTTCTGVRAIVLSLSNVDPIPDGSTLYTCQVAIASDAPAGEFTLGNTNTNSSNPAGGSLPTTGVDGIVTVTGGAADATIHVGSTTTAPGGNGSIDVTLETGVPVAGTQNDIEFTQDAAIRADEFGDPMCVVNPAIRKTGTSFAFLPSECTVGSTCTGVRAIVLSLSNVDPIPTGSRLYSCDIVAGSNEGTFPLTCTNPNSSSPGGGALPTDCTSGSVTVGSAGGTTLASAITAEDTSIPLVDGSSFPPSGTVQIGDEQITYTGKENTNTLIGAVRGANGTTAAPHAAGAGVTLVQVAPTATVTNTVAPTATSTIVPTSGATSTATATRTAVATATRTTGGGVFTPTTKPSNPTIDDGCAIVSPAAAPTGWLLLLPAAMLLWVRRRSR